MTVNEWAGPTFSKSLFRAAFAELGDKTFFLFMALIVWEPMRGIYAGRALWKRLCVFCGAYGALLSRTILMSCNIKPDDWRLTFDFLATAALFALSIVAVRDLRREGTFDKQESEGEEPVGQPNTTGEGQADAANPFAATEEDAGQSYGAAATEKAAPKPKKSNVVMVMMGSRAFLIAYVVTFLVDIDDKSPDELLASAHTGFDFAIGALIGQLLTMFTAMVFAFALSAAFDDKQLAMAVVLVTAGLFVTSLSQAFLSIPPLRPSPRTSSSFLALSIAPLPP